MQRYRTLVDLTRQQILEEFIELLKERFSFPGCARCLATSLNVKSANRRLSLLGYIVFDIQEYSQLSLNGHLYKTDTWSWSLLFFNHFTVTELSLRQTPL